MAFVVKTFKWVAIVSIAALCLGIGYYSYLVLTFDTETLPENYGRVHAKLYLGEGENQPLLVGFGGAEGGNAWASDYWKPQRDRFLKQGYAFLALAYFGEEGLPKNVDRISLDAVHEAILKAASNRQINQECIALIGGSKGAELALVLASYYPDIKAVVGIVPGRAVFAAQTIAMNTSSWTFHGGPLPFVPVPWSAVPALIVRDLRGAWEEMLKQKEAVEKAAIAFERINGPIFLLSATRDEFWPSTEMSNLIVQRLQETHFPYKYAHVAIEGNHHAPQKHNELVEDFLRVNFLQENAVDCPR